MFAEHETRPQNMDEIFRIVPAGIETENKQKLVNFYNISTITNT